MAYAMANGKKYPNRIHLYFTRPLLWFKSPDRDAH